MYGTTEIGVILVSYPGAPDFVVKPGSLGKPIPAAASRCRTPRASPARPA
jgi:acetyl-CoA synthetase